MGADGEGICKQSTIASLNVQQICTDIGEIVLKVEGAGTHFYDNAAGGNLLRYVQRHLCNSLKPWGSEIMASSPRLHSISAL